MAIACTVLAYSLRAAGVAAHGIDCLAGISSAQTHEDMLKKLNFAKTSTIRKCREAEQQQVRNAFNALSKAMEDLPRAQMQWVVGFAVPSASAEQSATAVPRPEGLRIDQQLLIPRERKSVRKILEARLPGIATSARRQLRAEFGRPVFLHLSIGVASNVFELESARPHDVLQMLADRGPDARET
jgi:hypothetical protein